MAFHFTGVRFRCRGLHPYRGRQRLGQPTQILSQELRIFGFANGYRDLRHIHIGDCQVLVRPTLFETAIHHQQKLVAGDEDALRVRRESTPNKCTYARKHLRKFSLQDQHDAAYAIVPGERIGWDGRVIRRAPGGGSLLLNLVCTKLYRYRIVFKIPGSEGAAEANDLAAVFWCK
eukprot:SAG31_NODE_652_length_13181_cov_14.268155_2_plen_175_part_00